MVGGLLLVASLAFIGSAIAVPSPKAVRQADATVSGNVTLSPVTISSDDVNVFKPSTNVSLPYGQTAQSFVSVGLTTTSVSVLLETISSLVSVDCSSDSVSLTFDNADDLDSAYSEWSSHSSIVLVTNHMGDCDTEFERGFFTADSYTTDSSTLTLVASTQKSNINEVASYIRTNFTGLPATAGATTKRGLGDITFDPAPINFSTELVLNETTLYSDGDFTATLESGSLTISVTVGGFLTYNILKSELVEIELYLESNPTSDIVLDLGIDLPLNKSFSYVEDVESYTVDIPGVLSFGPQISFIIGADASADAAVDVSLDLSSKIYNGSITLDYTGDFTAVGSWDPQFDITVTVSEAASVAVTPYVTTSFAMEFDILGGTYTASGGIAPQAKFPTSIALDASEEIGAGKGETATTTDKGTGECANGVELLSELSFSLDAFVTGHWDDEYAYNVTLPVVDKCISW